MKPLVLGLNDAALADIALVGGKAASLGKMYNAGIRIPLTLCVTTQAYSNYLSETGIGERILLEIERKAFADMRWEELWDSSLRLRNLFLSTSIQTDLLETLTGAIEPVFRNGPVVVRSSAPGEDSEKLSFAGLHESFLNVHGIEDILDHIRLVWASLFSDRALLYRSELGLDPRASTMAVVIQEMIGGECSGVAFGLNPLDPDQSVLESVYGLNQDLVDGLTEPHRWFLNRNSGEVVSYHGPFAYETNGSVAADTPLDRSDAVSAPLDKAKIREIFELLRRTELLFGCPQDVEWTYSGHILYGLQSRPITSSRIMEQDERRWYLSLRRSFENLMELRAEIENSLIPAMQREASGLAGIHLEGLGAKDLIHEMERRRSILNQWEHEYKEKCIPFAHGMRLFGEVYNDQVRPEDPFEFMDLLGSSDMLSVKRNAILASLAELLRNDSNSLECLYQDNMMGCREDVLGMVRQFQEAFGGLAWGSESLFADSRAMATLIQRYMERWSRERRDDKQRIQHLVSHYLASFPDHRKEYGATLLDLARASYRLRDDDNIYMGKISGHVAEAEDEARRRGLMRRGEPSRSGVPRESAQGPVSFGSSSDDEIKSSSDFQQSAIVDVKTRQVVGQPASAGLATGKARVILSSKDLFEFRDREILVCDAIDPNMTFVVPLAAGIVERRGGMLIHGAIIAREYGVPCVTGVPQAAEVIRTGDTVTVDGFLGIVIIG